MCRIKVLTGLHFRKPGNGALKFKRTIARGIEFCGFGCSGADEFYAVVVQRIDERNEALGFITFFGVQLGDAADKNRMETSGDGKIIRRALVISRKDRQSESRRCHHNSGERSGYDPECLASAIAVPPYG